MIGFLQGRPSSCELMRSWSIVKEKIGEVIYKYLFQNVQNSSVLSTISTVFILHNYSCTPGYIYSNIHPNQLTSFAEAQNLLQLMPMNPACTHTTTGATLLCSCSKFQFRHVNKNAFIYRTVYERNNLPLQRPLRDVRQRQIGPWFTR